MSGIHYGRRSLVIAASIIMLWGCGGGGGGSSDTRSSDAGSGSSADTTAPTIGTSSIVDGATDVPVTPTITLTFSETLDPASVSDATIYLQPAAAAGATAQTVDQSVPASVTASGATVTVTPLARLGLRKNYTLTVGDSVTDTAGNAIAASTIAFTTRDGTWGDGTTISTAAGAVASEPQVASGGNGEVLAVWISETGGNKTLWSSRLSAGVWGVPEAVQPTPQTDMASARVASDGAGRYLVVWVERVGLYHVVHARIRTQSDGWGAIEAVQANTTVDGDEPMIAMNASGQAAVAWREGDPSDSVWVRRYSPVSGWDTATRLDAISANMGEGPAVITIDDTGHSKVVWVQGGGNNDRAYTASANFGVSWGPAQRLDADESGPQTQAGLAIDGTGNGHAIWIRTVGGIDQPWTSRVDAAGSTWSAPAELEVPRNISAPLTRAAVSVSRGGSAMVVVTRSRARNAAPIGSDTYYLRYVPGAGWGTAQPLELDDSEWWYVEALQLDADGNAIAVMVRTDGTQAGATYSLPVARRYVAGAGWTGVRELESTGLVQDVLLAASADGTVTAVWLHRQGGGAAVTRASRFE